MSTTYAEIAACLQRISQAVGPCNTADDRLATTGRAPAMRPVDSVDLIGPVTYARLQPSTRDRITSVLQEKLSWLRSHIEQEYSNMIVQHRSLSLYGLDDVELETSLVRLFEKRYEDSVEEIRAVLAKLLSQQVHCSDSRSSNSRGGFGDVSPPPPHSKLTISANPPNPRNSIQLHQIPPLNRNRPLVKIDFIGTSSSTSLSPLSIHCSS